LKTWEYEKDGLQLQKIIVLDNDSKNELFTIMSDDFRRIYKEPIPTTPLFDWDKLTHYYLSIQLPIPLSEEIPTQVSHQFIFRDTIENKNVTMNGGLFSPRKDGQPIVIASPLKSERNLLINQSTLGYHFDALFFLDGEIYTPERFAFDQLRLDSTFTNYFIGDPTVNESYINYRDTLYAVADGTINFIQDGMQENSGNLQDAPLVTANDYGGNYLILEIGSGLYAYYCHVVPNSFMVNTGDEVKEGDLIGLLGNSGNSTGPHLHFHISDGTDLFRATGVPFVLKSYTKIGNCETGLITPEVIENAMMEEMTIINLY
ncbi:MAG: hypothetical protein DRJ05_16985, partial [Bacteroidetes bacterium]